MESKRYNAAWWSKDDDSAWENVKSAFQRDLDQTKHDFGGKTPDTIKQATGKQTIPPPNVPNFEAYEPAFRFGYGARNHYGKDYPAWDDRLEKTLQNDWSATSNDVTWNTKAVRRGYEYRPSL